MKKYSYILSVIVLFCSMIFINFRTNAQERIMSYNLLNYPGSDSAARNPYFRQVIEAIDPDVLVAQEVTSQGAVNGFLNSVMNFNDTLYASATFIDGYDSDNALFYKKTKFTFISNTPILTDLRDISEFVLQHISSGFRIHIFSMHLRSSSGQINEDSRALEIDSLRQFTNQLPAGTDFIVCGDCNIYNSTEPAYLKLLEDNIGDDGNVVDPLNMPGTWNDPAYALYHTQSPRNRLFGGGISGGLNDRFDLMLNSNAVTDSGGIKYIPGSLTAFGNDGNHYNDSINSLPNTAVSITVADAIAYASDHLPVYSTYLFGNPDFSVIFSEFTVELMNNNGLLNWQTTAESNLKGFHIERRIKNGPWLNLGFVNGHGNTTIVHDYNYTDKSLVTSGIYYYRLRMEDYNGTFSYSEIKEINFNKYFDESAIDIFPNPFSGLVTISIKNFNFGRLSYSIQDLAGQFVIKDLALDVNASQSELLLNHLAKGFYYLDLSDGNKHVVKKLIRQ